MRADYRFSPKSAAIFVLTLRDNYNNNNYPKMKKILSMTLLTIVILQSACAGDVITHDTKRLPEAARKFISTYFTKAQVSHIKIESELFQTQKYEVLLTDRTEIDFNRHGEWLEVDCDKSPVPVGLIPPYVAWYMQENFPGAYVVKIERKRRGGVEIDLNNDWTITFNARGEVIEVDD